MFCNVCLKANAKGEKRSEVKNKFVTGCQTFQYSSLQFKMRNRLSAESVENKMMIFHESRQEDFVQENIISDACTVFTDENERRPREPVNKKLLF